MAVTSSGWHTANFTKMLNAEVQTGTGGLNLTLATWKIALYANTITPNFDDTAANSRFGAGVYAAGEVFGTGWATGGVLLSAAAAGATSTAPTLSVSPARSVMWDMNDIAVSSTTLAAARCCTIYADPISAPNAKPVLILVNFAADFTTSNGTFGIQWSTLGVSAIAM